MSVRTVEESRQYRATHLAQFREYSRKWEAKNKEAKLAYRAAHKDMVVATIHRWRERNEDKVQAYQAINGAVRRGKIVKPNMCSECGAVGRVEAHHHKGYAHEFWFNVLWLCRLCHKKQHRKDV